MTTVKNVTEEKEKKLTTTLGVRGVVVKEKKEENPKESAEQVKN